MIHVALYQPEIPPNTGNIVRLCANTGATLHLIHPLGFLWDDKKLKRAGMDYSDLACVKHHENYDAFLKEIGSQRIIAFTTKAIQKHADIIYQSDDILLFGPESRGLPAELLASIEKSEQACLPMRAGSRSLNLSNAVAVGLYEAWRQLKFF